MIISLTLTPELEVWAQKQTDAAATILALLQAHVASTDTPTDRAAAVLKENVLKVPENMEFEIPQIIGPEVWQTLDRSSRVTFGKQVKREAAEFGLEFVRTTVSRHAVYKKRVVVE
ncbi:MULTISPECIES: hypothetical protein [Pseudomonas]|uniref:Uncharacterized protein n=2 Tax=Pseudomonas TaxID=286 RepID=A0A2K4W2G3_9PSED|nr:MULTISPECIES: hypothetical protein [Pseudomonas]MDH4603741.1 hypothetical protein [Pseudomonas syringae pv. papulans]MDH4625552.1 hypothetical protein [Pseudomonas syringae pv. papulans]SOS30078.1 hypothetical protein PL963_P100095 [Pseudomonas cerasi]